MKLSKKSQEEEKHKEFIAAISRIAISGSAAHEKRRSEIIRTVKTLYQLTELLNRGLQFKLISYALPSPSQKWKNKRREMICNNSSEVNFGQELETSKSSLQKIC